MFSGLSEIRHSDFRRGWAPFSEILTTTRESTLIVGDENEVKFDVDDKKFCTVEALPVICLFSCSSLCHSIRFCLSFIYCIVVLSLLFYHTFYWH